MTHTPSPEPNSQIPQNQHSNSRPAWQWQLARASLGLAIAIGGGIGYWQIRSYVYTRLIPQVETTLLAVLERPVHIGAVEGFSPIGIRFGPSTLPPTETDEDQGRVDAVQVHFNPLEVLFKQQLSLNITLVNPSVILDQDSTGTWLQTRLNELEPGRIEIKLSQLNMQNATVALLPSEGSVSASGSLPSPITTPQRWLEILQSSARPHVILRDIDGRVGLRNDNQRILLDVEGQPLAGGSFQVDGTVNLNEHAASQNGALFHGVVEAQRLPMATLAPLGAAYLPAQLGTVTSGLLSGRVRMRLTDVTQTTAIAPELAMWGQARVWDVSLQSPWLPNPIQDGRGRFTFQRERIGVQDLRARFGEIRAQASGRIHLRDGYNITASLPSVSIQKILEATALDLPVETRGVLQTELQLTGELDTPQVTGTLTNKRAIWIDKIRFDTVQARLRATTDAIDVNAIEIIPRIGGTIIGNGQLAFGDRPTLEMTMLARELPADRVLRRVLTERLGPDARPPWTDPATGELISLGAVAANININGALDRLQARAEFQAPNATFPTQGEAVLADGAVVLNRLETEFPSGNVAVEGRVDLAQQRWQGVADINQLPLNQFPLSLIPFDQLPLDLIPPNPLISTDGLEDLPGVVQGQMSAAGTLARFNPNAIALNGQLELSEAPLLNEPLDTTFQWTGEQLRIETLDTPRLSANGVVDLQFDQTWIPVLGPFDVAVQVNELNLAEWNLPFPKSLYVAGVTDFEGRIFGTLERPAVDGLLQFDGLTINQVAFEPLAGPVQYSADQGIRVDLQGDRDRIAALVDSSLRPQQFALYYGTTPDTTTRVEGRIAPATDGSGRDRLMATIDQFPLSVLNVKPAAQFQLGAIGGVLNGNVLVDLANWDWQNPNPLDTLDLTGAVAIARPSLGYLTGECFQGNVRMANGVAEIQEGLFRVRHHAHSPTVSPTLQSCETDLEADEGRYTVNGRFMATPTPSFNGEIEVEQGNIQDWLRTFQFFDLPDLARGLRPAIFDTASDVAPFSLPFATEPVVESSNTTLIRQLQRYAEIVALRSRQLRQEQTEFRWPQLQDLQGTFSGNIDLAATPETGLTAEFELLGNDWEWGPYTQPNQLIAQGQLADGTLSLLPLRFESGESRLNFAGSVGWGDDATGQFQATNISVDWLRQFFKLPLDIDGNLNATAAITGNLDNPQARGQVSLSNASLNQTPIQSALATFSYEDARLGVIGNMQLEDENQPAPEESPEEGPSDSLQENPVNNLDDSSSDSDGAIATPSSDPSDSTDTPEDPPPPATRTPIALIGSLPYRFPQATVQPERDDINLQIAVEDEGIALLNLLNDYFLWEDGNGMVTLDVGGTLRQTEDGIDFRPKITGAARIDSATFSAQVLPAPLTDVVADIQFDGDRITVNTFNGRFSEGDFAASGVIPLIDPFTATELADFAPHPSGTNPSEQRDQALAGETPTSPDGSDDSRPTDSPLPPTDLILAPPSRRLLALQLNDLEVNYKGVYNGDVNGQIQVRGTALAPELGGGITLSNGRISLPDPATLAPAAPDVTEDDGVWAGLLSPPELTDLRVTLGRRLLITRLPILNFVATGELTVNGPLQTDLRTIAPEGVINLHSGQVNLFTTQFNLDRRHDNTATFTTRTGTDPFLNVRLQTSVLEETRRVFSDDTTLSQSEIADPGATAFAQFQTIRIQASVDGLASQLFDQIELTSSPSRSEAEIVALIGGGFVDTLGRSEGFIGIANLAGTALFTSLQTLISNAIGFSDFRIFPTVITDTDQEEEGGGEIRAGSTLALAAELGLQITNDLSVSALQLLTVREPTQYNLRYQINNEFLLRGSTNFSDENRIILEYETRF